jgi:hypothetical protein
MDNIIATDWCLHYQTDHCAGIPKMKRSKIFEQSSGSLALVILYPLAFLVVLDFVHAT